MITAVQNVYSQMWHLLCIYHLLENVKKKAKSKLQGDMIKSFVSDFYIMKNNYSKNQFDAKYQEMLTKYELCRSYLKKQLYSNWESWVRFYITKIFTVGVESTQHVESINSVIVDQGILLKELVITIEWKLDKESQYTWINEYYGSNLSVGLPSTYSTIFKELDFILQTSLSPISLSIQRAQMNQSLLYRVNLILINQVEDDGSVSGILERSYDVSQIHLQELLNDISYNDITEL